MFTLEQSLIIYIKSIRNGVSYECDQCNYKATQQINVTILIKTVHKRIKYYCHLYKVTKKSNLTIHTLSMHKQIKYSCYLSEYTCTYKHNLVKHIKSIYE